MDAVLSWGLDVARAFQGAAPAPLVLFMRGVSALGSSATYVALAAFLYWCVDEKKSLRLACALAVSAWLNFALKYLLDQPRPFFPGFDPSVGLVSASMGGLPSGHAQTSLVALFIIASWRGASWGRSKARYPIAALLCLLIGFSRVFLGAHFPTDVLGGWIVGGALLLLYFLLGPRVEALLEGAGARSGRAGTVALAALSFAMLLYRPADESTMVAGALLGFGLGYAICRRRLGLAARAPLGMTGVSRYVAIAIRLAIGAAGALALAFLTGRLVGLFPENENRDLFVFARFALLALWVTLGAPWVFKAARLSESNVIHYQEDE